MQFVSPARTKTQIDTQILSAITDIVMGRLSSVEALLLKSTNVLDGVSLEELTNFSVPLTSQQTQDQLSDGILLGYKNGKLVEENNLNGGTF